MNRTSPLQSAVLAFALIFNAGAINLLAADPLPYGLTSTDIAGAGDPSPTDSVSVNGSAITVSAHGAHFPSEPDLFNFLCLPVSGDFDIKVRVSQVDVISYSAAAGLMVRENLVRGSRFHSVTVTPATRENGYNVSLRSVEDAGADQSGAALIYPSGTPPYPNAWLRLARVANTFKAYRSADGVTWEQLGNSSTPSTPYPCTVYVGLSTVPWQSAVTAQYDDFAITLPSADTTAPALLSSGSLNGSSVGLCFSEPIDRPAAESISNYRINAGAVGITSATLRPDQKSVELTLASALTAPFVVEAMNISDCADNVGGGIAAGTVRSATFALADIAAPGDPAVGGSAFVCDDTAITVSAHGGHFSSEPDLFNLTYLPMSGDFDIKVRVSHFALEGFLPPFGSGFSAEAGLMVRETLVPGSRFHSVAVTPVMVDLYSGSGNQYSVSLRQAADQGSAAWIYPSGAPPYPNAWLRLKRAANTFTVYRSSDGVVWEQLGNESTPSIPYPCTVYVGLSTIAYHGTATAEYRDLSIVVPPADNTSPTLVSSGSLNGSSVGLCFSEPIDRASAENVSNYRVNAGAVSITSATLRPDQKSVELTLASALTAPFVVETMNISDCAGNVGDGIAAGTVRSATFALADIAAPGDPPVAGSAFVCDDTAITVSAHGGHFSWEPDLFSFTYLPISGDFDIKVRVSHVELEGFSPPFGIGFSAEAGLMVRETLVPGSRFHSVAVRPVLSDLFAGNGNDYTVTLRQVADEGSEGWRYPNGAPPYPNAWLRLQRAGNTFTAYRSSDGVVWEQLAQDTPTIPYPLSVYIGLSTIASHGTAAADYRDFSSVDVTPPVIACPGNISVPASGPNGTTVSFAATATDDQPGVSVSCSPASGTLFAIGATAVTCTATDASGNQSSCGFTVTVTGQTLSALGPAQVWIGLKNSDDVGTKFDLLTEVFKNGSLIGSGQLNSVPGGSSGFNNAVLRSINTALPANVVFAPGDTLSFKLSVRIAVNVSGHSSGTARLWFNDSAANSRFSATVDGTTTQYFLLDNSSVGTSAEPGPKKTIDVLVNKNVGGNPFKPFGTWTKIF